MTTQESLEKRLALLEAKVSELESLKAQVVTAATDSPRKKLSLREFLNSIKIKSDVQKTLAIGYYFEKFENRSFFNAKDIKSGFSLAKEQAPKNVNDTVNKNIQKGLMMDADQKIDDTKAWTLTNSGIEFIDEILKVK